MKIVIFNWKDIKSPQSGGAEIVTQEYARGWVQAGHKVSLICPAFVGSPRIETIDGVKIIRLGPKSKYSRFLIHILAFFYYQKYLKGKVDLVIDQIHWVPFFTPLYVKEKKLAFIHEVAKDIWIRQFGEVLGNVGKFIEPILFRFYRTVPFLTVSESTKKDLAEFGISQVNVINNGVNIKSFSKTPKKEKDQTLIYVGRLTKAKNVEDVIKAFLLVNKKIPACHLWIVGGADDMQYLNKLKKEVNNRVKFWGFVTDEEKEKLMAESHLLVHASLTEGWGLVIIEAAAMGTPAVVYNVPGLSESVVNDKTGVVCSKNTPEEMAKQILGLLSNNKKYQEMQKNCLVWAKEFSWEKSIKKSLKLIESL